jgi:hypothetical protein
MSVPGSRFLLSYAMEAAAPYNVSTAEIRDGAVICINLIRRLEEAQGLIISRTKTFSWPSDWRRTSVIS